MKLSALVLGGIYVIEKGIPVRFERIVSHPGGPKMAECSYRNGRRGSFRPAEILAEANEAARDRFNAQPASVKSPEFTPETGEGRPGTFSSLGASPRGVLYFNVLGRVDGKEVCEIRDEEGEALAHVGDLREARAWVSAYTLGYKDGLRQGQETIRRQLREALGVPHPVEEE